MIFRVSDVSRLRTLSPFRRTGWPAPIWSRAAKSRWRTEMRTVVAARYVMPFKEGGAVPALIETDDSGMYVVKLRGAAQVTQALLAEVLA